MESIVKELEQYKKWNENLNGFLKENDFKDEKELIKFIKETKNHKCISNHEININDSEYIKELNNINHELNILKYDLLSIKRGIYKYKIKKESTKKLKEIKEYNLSKIYNGFSDRLSEIENEFNEWCKIPKCTHCDIVFDKYNHSYSVKKYDLAELCMSCIEKDLRIIIKKQKFIKNIEDKYKNNKVVNKLLGRNYHNLTLYKDIYIDSQQEQISLYDSDIIKYAGFDPNNPYDKYKLNNLCYRANKLIELYDDKISLINIPESDLARMGKIEFQALCGVLYDTVGGYSGTEDIIKALNMNNEVDSESDDSDNEPPSDFDDDESDDAIEFGRSMLQRQGITNDIF